MQEYNQQSGLVIKPDHFLSRSTKVTFNLVLVSMFALIGWTWLCYELVTYLGQKLGWLSL